MIASRDKFTEMIIACKVKKGIKWKDLGDMIGLSKKFGDGIMSAIDFSIDIQREHDPKGDRVNIALSGKFLPYKTY